MRSVQHLCNSKCKSSSRSLCSEMTSAAGPLPGQLQHSWLIPTALSLWPGTRQKEMIKNQWLVCWHLSLLRAQRRHWLFLNRAPICCIPRMCPPLLTPQTCPLIPQIHIPLWVLSFKLPENLCKYSRTGHRRRDLVFLWVRKRTS